MIKLDELGRMPVFADLPRERLDPLGQFLVLLREVGIGREQGFQLRQC